MHYHISPTEGLTQLNPAVPHGAGWEEPRVSRICAAPTPEQCILGTGDYDVPVVVYAIDQEPDVDNDGVRAWPDGGVYDAIETGEVWYLTPVPCHKVGIGVIDFVTGLWEITLGGVKC